MPELKLDSIDWNILRLMQGDARLSNVELAKAVGLSPSPCLNRVRALEEAGYIKVHKGFIGRKTNTLYQVTKTGEKHFRQHLSALEKMIKGMK